MAASLIQALSEGVADVASQVRASTVQVRVGRGGIGSGVIWSAGAPEADGLATAVVITNAHVVRAGGQSGLMLRLANGRELPAEVRAVDVEHDLAALHVRGTDLHAAEIGDSSALRVGEVVIAVGNPWGREGAVTFGVVAARAPADPAISLEPAEEETPTEAPGRRSWGPREWRPGSLDLIQADIRLYPGNSGGPLADAAGRIVGINAMIGGGLAFAIPSRTVQHFLQVAQQTGERAFLGVRVLTAALPEALRQRLGVAQSRAALVAHVEPGSPAERAGVLVGDVLLAVDGHPIARAEHLAQALVGAGGQPRTLAVLRGGAPLDVTLVPELRAAA